MDLAPAISENLRTIRKQHPLILNVTNFVAMDFSANALLAVGASPVMAMEPQEMDELVAKASAVAINMGTLDERWEKAAKSAWISAKENKKPVIFDPVGAGATSFRTNLARELLKNYGADIVRGNASEIFALLTNEQTTKGVDSTLSPETALEAARKAALEKHTTFVISGETDYIVSPRNISWVKNGHPKMTQVTAMGCVATSIIATFRGVETDSPMAALKGMALVGLCGEIASRETNGPGSLRSFFLDLLAKDDLPLESLLKVGEL